MPRVKKVIAGIAALAALAFGGATIANAGGGTDHQTTLPAGQSQGADQDQGEAPDVKGDDANEKGDDANEQADSEKADDDNGQPDAETNDDGPGGEMESPGQ